jgi:hypothetical protein
MLSEDNSMMSSRMNVSLKETSSKDFLTEQDSLGSDNDTSSESEENEKNKLLKVKQGK